MAVFLERLFPQMTGCHCQFSGLINSCLFCPFPSVFMVPFNHFVYRRKKFGLIASPPLSPPCFRPPVPLPIFLLPWSTENITYFALACSSLRKSLQSCFPSHALPLFPASAQTSLLVSFLSSLISRICSLPPCLPSVPFPQPQELQFILSSLLELQHYSSFPHRVYHLPRVAFCRRFLVSFPYIFSAYLGGGLFLVSLA